MPLQEASSALWAARPSSFKASANIRINSRHSRTSEVFTVSPSPISFPRASLIALFLRARDTPPLPAALVRSKKDGRQPKLRARRPEFMVNGADDDGDDAAEPRGLFAD